MDQGHGGAATEELRSKRNVGVDLRDWLFSQRPGEDPAGHGYVVALGPRVAPGLHALAATRAAEGLSGGSRGQSVWAGPAGETMDTMAADGCAWWAGGQDIKNLIRAAFFATPRHFFPTASRGNPVSCDAVWGRHLPSFFSALGSLLGLLGMEEQPTYTEAGQPTYRRVQLLVAPPACEDHLCCGPHCQCSFLASRTQSKNPQRVLVSRPPKQARQPGAAPGAAQPGARRPGAVQPPTRIYVPAWVANSPHGAVTSHGGSCGALGPVGPAVATIVPAPLRFHWRPTALRVVQRRGKLLFRDRIREQSGARTSRCILPQSLPQIFTHVDESLEAAKHFLDTLAAQERQMFGPEGTNAGMARALEAMCTVFDWGHLTQHGPTGHHVAEFGVLAQMLQPSLKYTEWPSQDAFPDVAHEWPDTEQLQVQYTVLMNRVRQAARMPRFRHSWWTVTGYIVEPLQAFASVLWVTRALLLPVVPCCHPPCPAAQQAYLCRVAAVISSFLGAGIANWAQGGGRDSPVAHGSALAAQQDAAAAPQNALAAQRSFLVSARFLARCGIPWQGRKRPHQRRSSAKQDWLYRAGPGNVGVLLLPQSVGQLVHVLEARTELDWSAVSASIDGDAFFSCGKAPAAHAMAAHALRARRGAHRSAWSAWHAVRIHNHCRPMGSPEACCERVGSLMQHQWTKRRHQDPSTLMDCVLLQDAQVACIGGERDEALCRRVALMLASAGRKSADPKRAHPKWTMPERLWSMTPSGFVV